MSHFCSFVIQNPNHNTYLTSKYPFYLKKMQLHLANKKPEIHKISILLKKNRIFSALSLLCGKSEINKHVCKRYITVFKHNVTRQEEKLTSALSRLLLSDEQNWANTNSY